MNPDNPPPRLRALIYNRVSSDPSGRRVSVESQDLENRSFCERQGWDVAATITDNDRSASRFAVKEREGYGAVRRALTGATHGRIDVLVCWESSRAQRDLADYVVMRDLCSENSVLLAYKGRIYNLAEGDDRFATGIDALVDEREAERIRDRVERGHRTSVAQGRPRGVVPYGYMRVYDPAGGHLLNQVPDPETSAVVQEIVRRILSGETLYGIAKDLNSRHELTPRGRRDQSAGLTSDRPGWSSSMIRNMLRKQSLIGLRTHHGVVQGVATWEPIVTPADWAAVQSILGDPTRRGSTGVAPRYLLSGIAECGVCGAWLRPLTNRGRPTYVCAGRTPTDGKGHVSRLRPPLDAMVALHVVTLMRDPGLLVRASEAKAGATVRASAAERELADLRATRSEYIAAAKQLGGRGAAASLEIIADYDAQIAEAQARMGVSSGLPRLVLDAAGPDADTVWDGWSIIERRQVVRALVRVVVQRSVRGPGRHGFDPSTIHIIRR